VCQDCEYSDSSKCRKRYDFVIPESFVTLCLARRTKVRQADQERAIKVIARWRQDRTCGQPHPIQYLFDKVERVN
jgi:hypothetical protein